jgi:alcohol dehydrogenase
MSASSRTTMKAAVLHKLGDPTTEEVLSVEQNVPVPTAGTGEILVKVRAASINPVDWKVWKGEFGKKVLGPVVGYDVSGVVEAIGPETETTLKVGEEIYADTIDTKGSFAEYVVAKAVAASPKPKNISFQEAASLPLAGLTALQALVTFGKLEQGQKVCIMGGSGGVGSLAVQIAKALGASHIYSTGTSVEMIKGFGADTVINYKEKSVVDELKGKELDLVFDTVGGIENWKAAKGGLKKGGIFVTIAGDGGGLPSMIPGIVYRKLASNFGAPKYELFLTSTQAPEVVKDMKTLTELVEAGKVKPVLDTSTAPFELTTKSIHDMARASMSGRTKGKLVLTVN